MFDAIRYVAQGSQGVVFELLKRNPDTNEYEELPLVMKMVRLQDPTKYEGEQELAVGMELDAKVI